MSSQPRVHVAETIGDGNPYCEPLWYSKSFASPFYSDSHRQWALRCRKFTDEYIIPNTDDWEREKQIPLEAARECYKAGLLPCVVGMKGWQHLSQSGDAQAPEGYDYFHELIFIDEIGRCASAGVVQGLYEGLQIGLPPVLDFAQPQLVQRIARPCLRGDQFIALAITEPGAGSDVANAMCHAVEDGDHFIVTGTKKWITNGTWADYFACAVRMGDKKRGHKGLAMLLLERSFGDIKTTKIDCGGIQASGTSLVAIDGMRVPKSNLLSLDGMKVIVNNFNHERWGFVAQANRFSRVLVEESLAYSRKRKTFGVPLSEHAVIRLKLAEMTRLVESTHSWLENLTYNLCHLGHAHANRVLGGQIALCKAHASKVMEVCAREAVQIFGGNGYTRGGLGVNVERLYRDVKAYAVPAGSEEIMLDLAARQAYKLWGSKL